MGTINARKVRVHSTVPNVRFDFHIRSVQLNGVNLNITQVCASYLHNKMPAITYKK